MSEINQRNEPEKQKKQKNKEILADFLSQTILIDKKNQIYIYKKVDNQFQLLSEKPFKPPILGIEIYNSFGDGIYRMDIRTTRGLPAYPNTIFFEIKSGIAKQIPSDIALSEEKPLPNPLQGAFIITHEAMEKLINALKQNQNQNPIDLSFLSEISKNFLKTQMEIFNEIIKNQIQMQKELITELYAPNEEEEEEEEEFDTETIAKAIKEGNYELIEEIFEDIFGKNGIKFARLLKLIDGYLTAQELKKEALKNEKGGT
jgi:HEPN domain-containing protein